MSMSSIKLAVLPVSQFVAAAAAHSAAAVGTFTLDTLGAASRGIESAQAGGYVAARRDQGVKASFEAGVVAGHAAYDSVTDFVTLDASASTSAAAAAKAEADALLADLGAAK